MRRQPSKIAMQNILGNNHNNYADLNLDIDEQIDMNYGKNYNINELNSRNITTQMIGNNKIKSKTVVSKHRQLRPSTHNNNNKTVRLLQPSKNIPKLISDQQNAQQQQMNRIYQQNQKLGYRINYLNDENNFYKISINNIQKLNNNIKKNLDEKKKNHLVTNNISIHNNNNNQVKDVNNNSSLKNNGKIMPNKLIINRKFDKNSNISMQNQLISTKQKQNTIHLQYDSNVQIANITQPFSLISNKIHLKNLQMKVGNSIRKTQKLKKLYEGSISSLTKKVQQLELQINKLSRQAEYNLIEEDLLKNIFKADYYQNLHKDWVNLINNNQNNNGNRNSYTFHINDNVNINKQNRLSKNSINSMYFNNIHMNNTNNKYNYQLTQNQQNNNIRLSKISKNSIQIDNKENKKSLSNFNIFNSSAINNVYDNILPMAVRILSNKSSNIHYGGNIKMSSNSQLCNLLQKQHRNSMIKNKNNFSNTKNKSSSYKQNNNSIHEQQQQQQQQQYQIQQDLFMSQRELFILPDQLIDYLIVSLKKQQMQQGNKFQSLRKQQKQQYKKKNQIMQKIKQLEQNKIQLKFTIEQQFLKFKQNSKNPLSVMNISAGNNSHVNNINNGNSNNNGLKKIGYSIHKRNNNTSKNSHQNSLTFKQSLLLKQNINNIKQKKHQADQMFYYNSYQKQLIQSIYKQDKLLEQQYKINQQYKQKIIDRNQQQNKQIKVLEEEVNKCIEQVKDIKLKYKNVCLSKGKNIINSNHNQGNNPNTNATKQY